MQTVWENRLDEIIKDLKYRVDNPDGFVKEAVRDANHDLKLFKSVGIEKDNKGG